MAMRSPADAGVAISPSAHNSAKPNVGGVALDTGSISQSSQPTRGSHRDLHKVALFRALGNLIVNRRFRSLPGWPFAAPSARTDDFIRSEISSESRRGQPGRRRSDEEDRHPGQDQHDDQ